MDNDLTAHVISKNDSIEFVVIGTPNMASEKLKELSKTYYDEHASALFSDQKEYEQHVRWHIDTVRCAIYGD